MVKSKSKVWTISKNLLSKIVKESNTLSEILRKIESPISPYYFLCIKERMKREGINFDHISLGLGSAKNKKVFNRGLTLEQAKQKVFIYNAQGCRSVIKLYLKKFSIFPMVCAECGCGEIWNSKKLVLQLDHIDGDPSNHKLDNLRWVCPNCHSQTFSFSGKHRKNKRVYFCEACNTPISKFKNDHSKKCDTCLRKGMRKIEWPTKDILLNLLKIQPISKIAEDYKVSANSVRRWCLHYDIDYKAASPFSSINKCRSNRE